MSNHFGQWTSHWTHPWIRAWQSQLPGFHITLLHQGHYPLPLQAQFTRTPPPKRPLCYLRRFLSLYQHPSLWGVHAYREALDKCRHQNPPTEAICDLICMIPTMNTFEFNNNFIRQLHGTAMGSRMAPSYANLFMGSFIQKTTRQSSSQTSHMVALLWRHIHDMDGLRDKLQEFINFLNQTSNYYIYIWNF